MHLYFISPSVQARSEVRVSYGTKLEQEGSQHAVQDACHGTWNVSDFQNNTHVLYLNYFRCLKRDKLLLLCLARCAVLVSRTVVPGVLQRAKESVSSWWVCMSCCHHHDWSSLTAKGLSCTQHYCACVCVCISYLCEVLGGGNSVVSPYHHLSLTTDVHPTGLFTNQPHCVCLWLCVCVVGVRESEMSYWSKAQIWSNSSKAHKYTLSEQIHLSI